MLVPIIQTATRYHLAAEVDGRGLASIEVVHRDEAEGGRQVLELVVTTDDDDVDVRLTVRAA